MNNNSKNKKAFTLAEVLVTLGIIGVVSAMTVPTLMQNYQRKSYVTQLHKVYNEITQAALQYQNDKNALNLKEAGLNSQVAANNFITTYFKVVSSCDGLSGCFADSYKKLSGVNAGIGDSNSYVIASGAAIRPTYNAINTSIISFLVDVNGKQGPNIAGRDLFIMCLYNNGVLDDANYNIDEDGNTVNFSSSPTEDERNQLFNSQCNSTSSGISGCFGKILNDNWEMTY